MKSIEGIEREDSALTEFKKIMFTVIDSSLHDKCLPQCCEY